MSNANWTKPKERYPGYEAKRAIAKDAWFSGAWIYNSNNGKWYSPEEFMKSDEIVNFNRGKDDANKFKIRDPKVGIIEKIKILEVAQKEVSEFINRVHEYYDLKPIRGESIY